MKAKTLKSLTRCLLASLTMVTGFAEAAVLTPTVSKTQGSIYNTSAMSTFATDGGDMAGMSVTVTFKNGGAQTASWSQDPIDSVKGLASGTSWLLSLSGNTDLNYWRLENKSTTDVITHLTINGRPGMTAFDYDLSPEYSPNSSVGGNIGNLNIIVGGHSMTVSNAESSLDVRGVYSDQLWVGGVFYGDLFLTLDLSFSDSDGGLSAGKWLQFASDTDTVAGKIPEPATLALFGLGLLGLGFSRSRKS